MNGLLNCNEKKEISARDQPNGTTDPCRTRSSCNARRRSGGSLWRRNQGFTPSREAQSCAFPGRFSVSVFSDRTQKLEITICDLQSCGQNGPSPPALCFHRARGRDALCRLTQRPG